MSGTVYVAACAVENIDSGGVCTAPVWVEQPQPVLPPLTLAEGTQVAFAIIGCWTVGLVAGLYFKAANTRF